MPPRKAVAAPLTTAEKRRAAEASRERRDGRPLLSVPEAARYLGVHETTVRKLIRRGELRSTKVGADTRIFPSDLDAYLDANMAS